MGIKYGSLNVDEKYSGILELIKESLIDIVQQQTFGLIHVRLREQRSAEGPEFADYVEDDE